MLVLPVDNRAASQTAFRFVQKVLPKAPKSFIYKLFRQKEVRANNKKIPRDYILQEGDEIRIYLKPQQAKDFVEGNGYRDKGATKHQPKKQDIGDQLLHKEKRGLHPNRILFQDEDVLFYDKPRGMLTQADAKGGQSFNQLLRQYVPPVVGCQPSAVHRLDRNTTGILCAGLSIRGLQEWSARFRHRKVQKIYLTILKGQLNTVYEEVAYLSRDHNISTVHSSQDTSKDQAIHTKFIPLFSCSDWTLVAVQLFTGKTHQIRAHAAAIGHPLYGDKKYGGGRGRYFLHAYLLRWEDKGKWHQITAPIPEAMKKLWEVEGYGDLVDQRITRFELGGDDQYHQ